MSRYEENYSERSFWEKLKKYAINAGKKVVYSALLGYYAVEDPAIPKSEKLKIYAALGYLILPIDLVPDFIPIVGYGDDLAVLLFALGKIQTLIHDDVKEKARRKMEEWFGMIDPSDPDIVDIEGHLVEVENGMDEAAVAGLPDEFSRFGDVGRESDVSAQEQDDFYHSLRQKIRKWLASDEGKSNKFAEYLLFAPDLFHLLCKLSMDPEVPFIEKAKLAGAIAYFVSPVDLLPESLLGPIGYLDDLAVAAYVLNGIVNKTDKTIVLKHWAGESDVLAIIQQIIKGADDMLGRRLWGKLKDRFK